MTLFFLGLTFTHKSHEGTLLTWVECRFLQFCLCTLDLCQLLFPALRVLWRIYSIHFEAHCCWRHTSTAHITWVVVFCSALWILSVALTKAFDCYMPVFISCFGFPVMCWPNTFIVKSATAHSHSVQFWTSISLSAFGWVRYTPLWEMGRSWIK